MRRRLTILSATAVALLVVGGVAVASIPDSSGVIHGCRKNSDGSIRVIDSATQTCANGWTALNWSQTGPQGPQGPQGPAGPTGPAGPAGLTGIHIVDVGFAGTEADFQRRVDCPTGERALSASLSWDPAAGYTGFQAAPINDGFGHPTGYTFRPMGPNTALYVAHVTCATLGG